MVASFKYIIFVFFILFNDFCLSQTLLRYDNVEDWDWMGAWWNPNPGGYYTNASVSGTVSAAILGNGNGSSPIEQNWYSFPNVTGLNPSYQYEFSFRLASYTFSSPSSTARGVDNTDYVDVQLSRNGGVSYVSELRITGNNNATWQYQTTGVINHTANGSYYSGDDVYQSGSGNNNGLSTGYSVVKLNFSGVTQIAVDILARVNAAGEEWWMDNFELWITAIPLPVEFWYFNGQSLRDKNVLMWGTYSEKNNDYFSILKSTDGINWTVSNIVDGFGDSESPIEYNCIDFDTSNIVYYKLFQNDFDGNYRFLAVLSLHRDVTEKKVVKIYDILGREVGDDYVGVVIILYSDGHTEKTYK